MTKVKIDSIETRYLINWNTQKIWKEEIISDEFIKHLEEQEIFNLIKEKNIRIGIISQRDVIEWIDVSEHENFWKNRIQGHICEKIFKEDDDFMIGCDYEDFKGRYFYVASLWSLSGKNKRSIILEYYH